MGDPHRPEDWLGGSTEQKHTVPKAKDTAGDLDREQAIGEKKRQLKSLHRKLRKLQLIIGAVEQALRGLEVTSDNEGRQEGTTAATGTESGAQDIANAE